jgi:hypothetical protein
MLLASAESYGLVVMVRFPGLEITQMAFGIYADKFVESEIMQEIGIQNPGF